MHRELCFILFHDRRNRISHTLHSYEECLGSTKLEEHIQTDRNMILIIGYIEIYDSLILAILILHIGKAQATVLHTIIGLDGNLTIKLYLSWSAVLSISNREFYGITLLPVGRISSAASDVYKRQGRCSSCQKHNHRRWHSSIHAYHHAADGAV